MRIAMVGLGKMGGNMALRLLAAGHEVVGFNRDAARTAELAKEGLVAASSLTEAVAQLAAPRAVWVMVPAGAPTEEVVAELGSLLAPGDTIVEGGNSRYTDSQRRAAELGSKGIDFIDCGTSGGIWGRENGYCLMVGGAAAAVERLRPIFMALAPVDGFLHAGPSGAGHYVKMIHNGIEYGLMQAYGEGFELLRASGLGIDLAAVANLWNHGSVVRSWLLELAADALGRESDLASLRDYVEDSGEGRWTVAEAIDRNVPAPVITLSLLARIASRQDASFSAKLVAALRREFGGHAVQATPGAGEPPR